MSGPELLGQTELRDCAALHALTKLSGVGNKRAIELVEEFRSPTAVLTADTERLNEFHYIDSDNIAHLRDAHDDLGSHLSIFEDCIQQNVWVRTVFDDAYPQQLRDAHAPLFIYARGDPEVLQADSVSFSGSREANDEATEWVADVVKHLASENYVVISGGANGVDAAAHRAALEHETPTIVVSATGHSHPYPEEHAELFERIVANDGAVVSHHPPPTTPSRYQFLDRNKTNSALSQAIVIGAADTESGSMAQYRDARDQGRDVIIPDGEVGIAPAQGLGEIFADEYEPVTVIKRPEAVLEFVPTNTDDTESSVDDTQGSAEQTSLDDHL